MASAGSHVWVGFIEALPVVGSVKEAVEWVLAVAADDSALAKEKLDVINGRLRRVLKLKENRCSGSSSGYSSQSTSGSSTPVGKKSSGLTAMHVESIPEINLMAHIIEVMGKHDKKKAQQSARLEAARTNEVIRVQEETKRKIRQINQNFEFSAPLVDDGKRARRGEHVINNDVITFYQKTVDDFMNQQTNLGIDGPLDTDTENSIMKELVVHFDENELYINANALIYGEFCRILKRALRQFLTVHRQGGRSQEDKDDAQNEVTHIIQIMNDIKAYVDHFAKVKWIGNKSLRQTRFEKIQQKVETMFTNWTQYFDIVRDKLEFPA
ncbi:uncharacterized protein LOC124467741 [Hypomesus transpacificus]|uniref:uncharacterized protein LOC124467741 n=1 Tax=Hypomesus transpacificus TaxID=137520 RepID=UPI001F07AEE2|nr:uncharacterized protein LOC124467741 [Hypomesus transpacificus]